MNPLLDFNIELKFPDENVPIYTVEDYMRDTENGTRKDYDCMLQAAEARGQGFGFTYMCEMEKAAKRSGKPWGDYNRVRMDASAHELNMKFDKAGELLNSVLNTTYAEVASAMQLYIVKKGGVIDCWPESDTAATFDFYNVRTNGEKNDTTKVGINYFAPEIQKKSDGDGVHFFRSHEPHYRNKCTCINTPDYININKKISDLKRVPTYKKMEKFKNNFKHAFIALPLIFAAIVVLIMMFWRIVGVDSEAFVDGISWAGMGGIGTTVMIILQLILKIVSLIYELLKSTTALVIGIIVILVLGLVGYGALGSIFENTDKWISGKALKKGEAAQKELKELETSAEYKRILEENKEYRKAQFELSEKWHREWYEKVKHRVNFMRNV